MKVVCVCVVLALSSHCAGAAGSDGQLQVIPGEDGQWKAYRDSVEVEEIAFLSMCGKVNEAADLEEDLRRDHARKLHGTLLCLGAVVAGGLLAWDDGDARDVSYDSTERKVRWPVVIIAGVVSGVGYRIMSSASNRLEKKRMLPEEAEALAREFNSQHSIE